jgi:AcrR family transcriptional regulator
MEPPCGFRRYHHGDLRRGLVAAAREILESAGPSALSLRAVARKAGVSPAAPYHHFSCKDQLCEALAESAWVQLNAALEAAADADACAPADRLRTLGVAYVRFALENPALYRLMCERLDERLSLTPHLYGGKESAYGRLRAAISDAMAPSKPTALEMEVAAAAAWCASHGVAQLASFAVFDRLKRILGGDGAVLHAIFGQLSIFTTYGPYATRNSEGKDGLAAIGRSAGQGPRA